MNDLYELCDLLSDEIAEATKKIRNSGGKMSGSDLDYVDKLTHALKSVKTTIAMEEAGGSYDGRPYGGSYARRRDSMGRYSARGYSRDDDMIAELRELMAGAKDDRTRHEFQRFIDKMESM